jgi:hypothetical protein
VAAIAHQKTKIRAGNTVSSFRMILGCAMPNIIKIIPQERFYFSDCSATNNHVRCQGYETDFLSVGSDFLYFGKIECFITCFTCYCISSLMKI